MTLVCRPTPIVRFMPMSEQVFVIPSRPSKQSSSFVPQTCFRTPDVSGCLVPLRFPRVYLTFLQVLLQARPLPHCSCLFPLLPQFIPLRFHPLPPSRFPS